MSCPAGCALHGTPKTTSLPGQAAPLLSGVFTSRAGTCCVAECEDDVHLASGARREEAEVRAHTRSICPSAPHACGPGRKPVRSSGLADATLPSACLLVSHWLVRGGRRRTSSRQTWRLLEAKRSGDARPRLQPRQKQSILLVLVILTRVIQHPRR